MEIYNILSQDQREKMYLDYFNNFLSVEAFADQYGIGFDIAFYLIQQQRLLNQHG